MKHHHLTIGFWAAAVLTGISGCSDIEVPGLTIVPTYQGKPVTCGQTAAHQSWAVETLQFYLSDFELDGQAIGLRQSDSATQEVVQIGMDAIACNQQNWQVQFESPLTSSGQTLSFEMAVPFEANHANPLLQPPPINNSRMFWSWQLGHKFLRLDMQHSADSFSFHLGSTGCKSESAMRAPAEPCRQPHRYRVELPLQEGFNGQVHFELDKLLVGVDLHEANCMSDDDVAVCRALYQNMQEQLSKAFYVSAP